MQCILACRVATALGTTRCKSSLHANEDLDVQKLVQYFIKDILVACQLHCVKFFTMPLVMLSLNAYGCIAVKHSDSGCVVAMHGRRSLLASAYSCYSARTTYYAIISVPY